MTVSENTAQMNPADAPAAGPRALTGRMRYRALIAKPVSMLLLICLIIVSGSVYTATDDIGDWVRIHRLKSIARSTTAEITEISLRRAKGERGAVSEYVTYEFRTSPDNEPIRGESRSSLFMHLDKKIRKGSKITVKYDPDNPHNFFCLESDDRTLSSRLAVQIIFLAAGGLLLILAGLRYFRLLEIICTAPAQSGRVAEIGPSSQPFL